ncbi:hypothetical protein DF3PA_170011 [Candidatus Defluviicoccus seviourii]|uniref:Uncharacterized protein n=1 Tax=Candidatus Defluviicoccus seviourii TaxID=2565273 RepID=A0A564WBN9_9PROT|nr:hypothetical protein DF3PA_170011 [Candidatus Defluviicoccus seviourii]
MGPCGGMADAADSKSVAGNGVGVRVSLGAPSIRRPILARVRLLGAVPIFEAPGQAVCRWSPSSPSCLSRWS